MLYSPEDKQTAAAGDEDDFRNYIGKSPKTMCTLSDLLKKKK